MGPDAGCWPQGSPSFPAERPAIKLEFSRLPWARGFSALSPGLCRLGAGRGLAGAAPSSSCNRIFSVKRGCWSWSTAGMTRASIRQAVLAVAARNKGRAWPSSGKAMGLVVAAPTGEVLKGEEAAPGLGSVKRQHFYFMKILFPPPSALQSSRGIGGRLRACGQPRGLHGSQHLAGRRSGRCLHLGRPWGGLGPETTCVSRGPVS